MRLYISDVFEVDPEDIEKYGAFNVSIVNDLPLFIDPFLLFTSKKDEYQKLHNDIIRYVKFLQEQAEAGYVDEVLLNSLYVFPEVK